MPKFTKPNSCASPMARALALWLNASNTAQKAAESTASLFVGIIFNFIGNFMFSLLLRELRGEVLEKVKKVWNTDFSACSPAELHSAGAKPRTRCPPAGQDQPKRDKKQTAPQSERGEVF